MNRRVSRAKVAAGSVRVARSVPVRRPVDATIRRAVATAAAGRPIAGLSIAVVSDGEMSRLHQQFMNDPDPTDVLTFDLREEAGAEALDGEIVVSAETACRVASELGVSPEEELLRYIVHGVLHLCGYDDRTPGMRRRMRILENRVLAEVSADAPPGARQRG